MLLLILYELTPSKLVDENIQEVFDGSYKVGSISGITYPSGKAR
jgi:hypothetical protein